MDWQGQKLAEQLMQYIVLLAAIISFLAGYLLQSYKVMMAIYCGGILVASLVTIPNWPLFNRNKLQWLSPDVIDASDAGSQKNDKGVTPIAAPSSKPNVVIKEKARSAGKSKGGH
eukprot:TRINITY_DN24494_c0_g1_i1.p1 TRINITY_DN24494_c0_g1~~TRINITY_DN24494_c0_g1_i1.p1  ORF type:complete len:115 (-),score=13.20 TRINITY_DN24494_c0_g1_i1:955-1299(-)